SPRRPSRLPVSPSTTRAPAPPSPRSPTRRPGGLWRWRNPLPPTVRAQTLVAARGLAAIARTQWPEAATIVTGECDQPGCIRQHAEEVLAADGTELGQMWELDGYEQEIIDTEAGLAPVLGQDVFSVSGNDYDGEGGVIDVEKALTPERTQTTAADRVKETIGGYRARFTDLDLDTRT